MRKQRVYCPYCAEPVVRREVEGKARDLCMRCSTVFYENPLPVASAIVVNEQREVLLVQREKEPYRGMWCLPIGFAETGEEVKDAALRELEEESGVKGKIVRLIDVDTVDNDFYGSLAIVTYEVRAAGGRLRPGDDATDARYFSIFDLPPLAWSSNDKAVKIYIDMYRDTWAMMDSFRQLFPDFGPPHTVSQDTPSHGSLLSNILIKIIDRDREEITRSWAGEVEDGIPSLAACMDVLMEINRTVLQGIQEGLEQKRQPFDRERFVEAGRNLRRLGLPLPDILNALALSRKSIWVHVIGKKILSSPLEIYSTLELNNRIIFLYDRVNYHITEGYMG
ncbi:MAG: NUDIX domain-containing protein [Desulfobacterota bacterium]|jgi:ADP-ribose pyrophosphatase YjhB (NUDIX family)|nr:NUDIX domain-containing protein [Thermodesulfobacteriota bacterium]